MQNQKGVSLLMVFFIMTIILSVVLGLSTILVNEFKEIRNLGDSLVAFYMADSGIEKALYYSRKKIPNSLEKVVSGICNICNSCQEEGNCLDCEEVGDDCVSCKSCKVSYTTVIDSSNNLKFETVATIFPNGDYYNLDISVKGFYRSASRAINLQIANKDLSSSSPAIITRPDSAVRIGNLIAISVDITDPDSIDPDTVYAHIRNSNIFIDPDVVDPVWLELTQEDGSITYNGSTNSESGFFINIRACDLLGNCGQSSIPIIEQ